MRRRGFLGALSGALVAPTIVRTPGLLMPISTLLMPALILRLYAHGELGEKVLLEKIRIDRFDFVRGNGMPHFVTKMMRVEHATVETRGHSRFFDNRETILNFGGPRLLLPGDQVGVSGLKFETH